MNATDKNKKLSRELSDRINEAITRLSSVVAEIDHLLRAKESLEKTIAEEGEQSL